MSHTTSLFICAGCHQSDLGSRPHDCRGPRRGEVESTRLECHCAVYERCASHRAPSVTAPGIPALPIGVAV